MRAYILKRIALFVPTIFGILTLVFFLIHLTPGDPVDLMLGETARAADKERLRRELRLDLPLSRQYYLFLADTLQGNLGQSFYFKEPVVKIVARRLPATLKLTLGGLAVALLLSFPLGLLAAYRSDTAIDRIAVFLASLGVSIPNFWLGPMLILVFAIHLKLLPVSGMAGPASLILPSLTLGTAMASILVRMLRVSLLETLRKEYLSTARAKGIREFKVISKHALANALIPVITVVGLQFGTLLSGSLITETIFSWPGLGRLTVEAIYARDFPLVQGCVLAIAMGYVLVNFITDLAYCSIDPRIRLS